MEKQRFPSDLQERFMVRLPSGMRDQIAASATHSKRSMNAEVVARLAASFDTGVASENPLMHVGPDIEEYAAKRGMSFRSALEALVTAALAPDAPAVVYISIQPGTPIAEVQQQLRALRSSIPETASVITDRPISQPRANHGT